MKKGPLNRRIAIERRTQSKDPIYGTTQEAWEPYVKVWAQVQDVLPSRAESISDDISIQRRPARVRMRFRDDITSDMRIIYQGRVLEIISGPAELGHRDGLELMVEESSTRGEAP